MRLVGVVNPGAVQISGNRGGRYEWQEARLFPVFVSLKQPGHASGCCATNSPAATPILAEAVGTRLIDYRMGRSRLHENLLFEVKTGAIDS